MSNVIKTAWSTHCYYLYCLDICEGKSFDDDSRYISLMFLYEIKSDFAVLSSKHSTIHTYLIYLIQKPVVINTIYDQQDS